MIYGIGCDSCMAARICISLTGKHGAHFAQRVFGAGERAALGLEKALPAGLAAHTAESAAANFAAKEAFLKAAGTGLAGFALGEIEALRAPSGAPYYRFSGAAAVWMEQNGLCAHLSLTHEGGQALAFCILEKTARGE